MAGLIRDSQALDQAQQARNAQPAPWDPRNQGQQAWGSQDTSDPAPAPATSPFMPQTGTTNATKPLTATTDSVGTAPPWLRGLNSSPPPPTRTPEYMAEAPAIGSPPSAFGKSAPYAVNDAPAIGSPPSAFGFGGGQTFSTRPLVGGSQGAGSYGGEASPGVQMGEMGTWEGGPNILQTRTDASGLPTLAGGLDRSGMPQLAGGLDTSGFASFDSDFAGASEKAAKDAYAGLTQFMDQDFSKDTDALRTQLVNQGLQPGSAAFESEMSRLSRGQNDARLQAAAQASQIGHQRAGDLLSRALATRQLQGQEAGQDAATRLASRGLLGQESNADAATRLASRNALFGERSQDADRLNNQSMSRAQLLLGARGQDMGLAQARENAMGQASAANASAAAAREMAAARNEIDLRRIGLDQDSMDFNQFMALVGGARGGVNMGNFGGTSPLDVGGAYGMASNNANAAANRNAIDRAGMAGLGASILGGIDWGSLFGP